jgi:integrase
LIHTPVPLHTESQIALPHSGSEALYWLRDILGTVAPRDPRNRRLGERRWRLELLAELCERETFNIVSSWLGSNSIPSVETKRNYADDVRLWAQVARELGNHQRLFIGAITPGMVETWVKSQQALGRAPRTINRRLSALSSLTQYAAWKTKTTIPSPVTKHDRIKVDRHDETTATPVITVEEFQRVVEAAETARQAVIPVLFYTIAARVSECCKADLSKLRPMEGRRVLDLRRKGGKGRMWFLPDDLLALIDAAADGRTTGPLLLDDKGEPHDRHSVLQLLVRLGKKSGVLIGRDLTPHVLRASRLTHMHRDKVPVEEIQEFADHAAIETTLGYIRRDDATSRKAAHAGAAVQVYSDLINRFSGAANLQK